MEAVLGAAAAVLGLLVVYLIFRGAERTAQHNREHDELIALQREMKRLQGQLEGQTQKYSQKAQEASKKDTKTKGREQRIQQLQEELQGLKSEHHKQAEQVKEMSREINRLRIAREELRAELDGSKQAATETPATPPATPIREIPAPVIVTAQTLPAEEDRPARGERSEERELERAFKAIERLEGANQRLKTAVVEREAAVRGLRQKAEHNRRAYVLTQFQLDLASDELYLLRHGEAPEHPQAAKAAKRASLKPQIVQVVPNRDQNAPIDLIGVGDNLEAPEEPLELGDISVEEVVHFDHAGDPIEEIGDAAVVEEIVAVVDASVSAPAEVDAAPAADAKAKKANTRLRKGSKGKADDAGDAGDIAPPRPAANS